jgi:hypothetical protein
MNELMDGYIGYRGTEEGYFTPAAGERAL